MSHQENILFSRSASPVHAEKLTEIPPVSVRFKASKLRVLDGLSTIANMERGEFIRYLVDQEEQRQHQIWAARDQLFSGAKSFATTTSNDEVGRE